MFKAAPEPETVKLTLEVPYAVVRDLPKTSEGFSWSQASRDKLFNYVLEAWEAHPLNPRHTEMVKEQYDKVTRQACESIRGLVTLMSLDPDFDPEEWTQGLFENLTEFYDIPVTVARDLQDEIAKAFS